MSTPPTPPSSPSGPPTEGAGTPIPEAAGPLSLEKTPTPTPEPQPAAASAPGPTSQAEPAPDPAPTTAAPEPATTPDSEPAAKTATDPATTPGPATKPEPSAASAPEPEPATTPDPALATAAPEPAPAPQPGSAPQLAAASAPQPAPAPAPEAAFAPPAPAPQAAAPQATAPQGAAPFGVHGVPGAPGGPVPPAPVWGAAYGPGPWGVPAPAGNGLAVAALVTGIAGLIGGLLPFFFFMGGLLALTAIGLGIGAIVRATKGAGRQAMAITGTVLGVLGIGASLGGFVLTGAVLDRASDRAQHRVHEKEWEDPDEYDEDFGDATPAPPAPKPSPSQVPGMTTPLPFGETYTYPNGIKVSLSVPKKYVTKNRYLEVGNAVQLTITITNNSTETHNVIYAVPNVRDEQGMTAKLVFDGELPKTIKGDILPGESASGVVAFEVPEGTGRLTADISPGIRLPNAKFSGPIG